MKFTAEINTFLPIKIVKPTKFCDVADLAIPLQGLSMEQWKQRGKELSWRRIGSASCTCACATASSMTSSRRSRTGRRIPITRSVIFLRLLTLRDLSLQRFPHTKRRSFSDRFHQFFHQNNTIETLACILLCECHPTLVALRVRANVSNHFTPAMNTSNTNSAMRSPNQFFLFIWLY